MTCNGKYVSIYGALYFLSTYLVIFNFFSSAKTQNNCFARFSLCIKITFLVFYGSLGNPNLQEESYFLTFRAICFYNHLI